MSTAVLNLWAKIQEMSLSWKDREWLAGKLIEPIADDPETAKQKAYVKETLYRALDEMKRAQKGEVKLKTLDEFIEEL